MMITNSLWGSCAALVVVGCVGVSLSACSSTSCQDTDSCGEYRPPNGCNGGTCADGGKDDISVVDDASPTDDAALDAALDGAPDDADVVRQDGAFDVANDRRSDSASDARDGDTGHACDVTKSPVDEPCVVDDALGVFVSPAGNDTTGAGTKTSPYATVNKGMAAAQGKNVYVCAGTYAEAVTVEGPLDGARLFGGFDCTTWIYAPANRAQIKPTTGTPLVAKMLAKGLRIEDLEFDAPATTTKGESSIAAWIAAAENVKFVRVKLVASAAQSGADGVGASNYDPALQQSDIKIAGVNASGATGGAAQMCANLCTNNLHSTGGRGGDGASAVAGDAGADAGAPTGGADGGPAITPADPAPNTGAAGKPQAGAVACTSGTSGSNAPTKSGGTGAPHPGTLTAAGWTRVDGFAGTAGGPGQGGGGGGGGQNATMGGGGGGGCGGCGGAAGPAGQSGGSSFALLSFQSTIALDACTLVAAAGGHGGKGADGQVGQLGGAGGVQTSFGCQGGAGGQGGTAGGGGGGAGGHSAAIGYVGTTPTLTNSTTTDVAAQAATAGAPGASGNPPATAGAVGKTMGVLPL